MKQIRAFEKKFGLVQANYPEVFMRQLIFSVFFIVGIISSCQNGQDALSSLCKGASADSYSATFKVWCPTQRDDYYVPVRYGCPPKGRGISPPIAWSGIPEGSTHLRVMVVDATCTYECDSCCNYHHWVLDIPLSEMRDGSAITPEGIDEGKAKDPLVQKYTLKNTSRKNEYMPFCPPKIQTHAYVYKLIAYKKGKRGVEITGRSQSMPLLYSF